MNTLNEAILEEMWNVIIKSLKPAKEAYNEPVLEHESTVNGEIEIHVFRIKTGYDANLERVKYWELRIAKVPLLNPHEMPKIIKAIKEYEPFHYVNYYEERFAITAFVFGDKVRGTLLPRKEDKMLIIPIYAKDEDTAKAVVFTYIANFVMNRLFKLLNAILKGKVGKPKSVWRAYNIAIFGKADNISSQIRSSIRYIIELISEVEKKVSKGLIKTVKVLFNFLQNSIQIVDNSLKVKVTAIRALKIVKFARKELKMSYEGLKRALISANNIINDMMSFLIEKQLEKYYNSVPIK